MLLRIAISVLSFSCTASAFGTSPLPPSRALFHGRSTRRLALKPNDCDDIGAHGMLLDESVLLYSLVHRQSSTTETKSDTSKSILELRKNEMTALIEGVVIDEWEQNAESTLNLEESTDESEIRITNEREPETLDEITRALDQQILSGYESSFTEEELAQWVKGIDRLQERLRARLAALPPGSLLSESTTISKPTESSVDQFQTRLERMQTLIDPMNSGRVILPMVPQNPDNFESKGTEPEPTEWVQSCHTTQSLDEQSDAQNHSNGSSIEASISVQPPSVRPNEDTSDTSRLLNGFTESSGTQPESTTSDMLQAKIPEKQISTTESERTPNEGKTANEIFAGSPSHVHNGFANDQSKDTIETPDAALTVGELDHEQHDSSEPHVQNREGADVVSTVITAAAVGAAAVTKLPLFAAGVALGPVIRDSISYAQNKMKTAKETKAVGKNDGGPGKHGEKGQKKFESK